MNNKIKNKEGSEIKEIEYRLKELELKKEELAYEQLSKQSNSKLNAPTLITLLTIVGGLLGAAVGAISQGYWNTKLEQQKFESEVILKALEIEDKEIVKKSLIFYIDIGIINSLDKRKLEKIIIEEPDKLPYYNSNGPLGENLKYTIDTDGNVTFISGWDSTKIKKLFIPQLKNVRILETEIFSRGNIRFYDEASEDLVNAFQEIEDEGLLHLIKSWDGSVNTRTIRGTEKLSEHALGIAFDINSKWNRIGEEPAKIGEEGSVIALVPIFKKHNFEWGWETKKDANHFVWKKKI